MATTDLNYETAGIIDAHPELVVRWWFDTSRADWYLGLLEAKGVIDLTVEDSVVGGTRIRVTQYMDRSSWKHHNVVKAPVFPDGIPERQNDAFVAPYTAVRTYTSPLGGKLTSTCDCRIELTSWSSGTHVRGVHKHSLSGMSGRRRNRQGQAEQAADEKAFADTLERCRLALGIQTGTI